MKPLSSKTGDGFTLVETVVATGVLVTALAGLAQLLALSARWAQDAGRHAAALTAAQGQVELLRSLAFSYGPAGEAQTDSALAPAGGGSLTEDIAGFVDYVDATGESVDVNGSGHGAVWTLRWKVTPIDLYAPEALAIEVCVFPWPAQGLAPPTASACLATVRTRQP
jgi:type II secretory pathway pseudopilin PulG